jgi:hypothetical protein
VFRLLYKQEKKNVSFSELGKYFTNLRNQPEFSYIKEQNTKVIKQEQN